MHTLDTIRKLMRPATLHCVGLDGGVLKNRVSIPARHVTASPSRWEELSALPTEELREVYAWSNGFRLFDLEGYNEHASGWALRVLSLNELAEETKSFRRVVIASQQQRPDEWTDCWKGSEGPWREWFDGLYPFALWGEGGDLLVVQTVGGSTKTGATVLRLEFETYCAGPFESSDCDQSWSSLGDCLAWLEEDLVNRIPSTWRFVDSSGEQYVIERIEYH